MFEGYPQAFQIANGSAVILDVSNAPAPPWIMREKALGMHGSTRGTLARVVESITRHPDRRLSWKPEVCGFLQACGFLHPRRGTGIRSPATC